MKREEIEERHGETGPAVGGLAGWLLERLRTRVRRGPQRPARLALIERIALAPRQSLALVEAEGRKLLVATSPEAAPVFYALDGTRLSAPPDPQRMHSRRSGLNRRISW